MTNPHSSLRSLAVAACGLAVLAAAGCGGNEPERRAQQAPAYTPPPPPPDPVPTVTPVSDLMTRLGIDERVELPEDQAPDSDEARIAMLTFFDAFARGDDQTVGEMLPYTEKRELDQLVATGAWSETTERVRRIELQTGASPSGEKCVLGLFHLDTMDIDRAYQPQLWYYADDGTGAFTFEAAPTPPGIMDKLSGDDWIARWHQLLEDELRLADAPDEEYQVAQQRLDSGPTGGVSVGSGPPTPQGPEPGGGGAPSRRPKKPKRKAPGPP